MYDPYMNYMAKRRLFQGRQQPSKRYPILLVNVRREIPMQLVELFGSGRVLHSSRLRNRRLHNSSVGRVIDPMNQALGFQPIHQLSHVRANATQSVCQLAQRQRPAIRHQSAQDGELRRRQSCLLQRGLNAIFERMCGMQQRENRRVGLASGECRSIVHK